MAERKVDNKGRSCPECGVSLDGRDLQGHSNSHWPEIIEDRPENAGAIARKRILIEEGGV